MKTIKIFPLQNPIQAEVAIPGSKSYTNRALLMAAMTKNKVKIINPLFSDDTQAMVKCLQTLGIKINVLINSIEVIGSIDDIKDNKYELDANLSGTTIRFILPLLTIVPGVKILKGKEGLNKRPIKDLVDALRCLGAKIEYLSQNNYPPLCITSRTLKPGTVTLNGGISSQYFSALLMVAPRVGKVIVKVEGTQVSKPYIDMTIDTMKKFGVDVIQGVRASMVPCGNEGDKKYIVPDKQVYKAKEYIVEGDFSSAGYFLAIAALTESTLTLKNLNPDSLQADRKILFVYEQMGSKITMGANEITIKGKGVKPIEVNMIDFPDQAQTLAVLAAFAKGTTKISGIQSLRVKETERVTALERELAKMDIRTSSTSDELIIQGGDPKPAKIDTYEDHRMAMAFAVAGAKLSGMEINDPDVVSKTFPDFWEKLNSINIKTELAVHQSPEGEPRRRTSSLRGRQVPYGAGKRGTLRVNSKNIVLIGMRGSGKTTVAKLLSLKLNKEHLELDEIIVEKTGMSIREIVKKYGWDYFRNRESEIAKEVSKYDDKVISTGGGIVVRSKNIEALRKNGILILLKASVETLLHRVGDDPNRPSLTNKRTKREEMEELLKQRNKLYEEAALETIDTENMDAEEVVNEILLRLKNELTKVRNNTKVRKRFKQSY